MPCPGSGQVPKATLIANNDVMVDAWTEWRCPVCGDEFYNRPSLIFMDRRDESALVERGAQLICPPHGVVLNDNPWIANVVADDVIDDMLEELDALPR